MIMTWSFVSWIGILILQWSIIICVALGRLFTLMTRRGDPGILRDVLAGAVCSLLSLGIYCALVFRMPPTGAFSLMNPWIGVVAMACLFFLGYRLILLVNATRWRA